MKIIRKNCGVNEELNERRLSQLQGIITVSRIQSLLNSITHPPHYTTIEIFRFKDKNEDKIGFKVFLHILNKYTPQNASFYFFSPEKLALLPLLEEIKPSPDDKNINDKTSYILLTCFCHCDLLTKTHSRMTTSITFSHQNYVGLCEHNLY